MSFHSKNGSTMAPMAPAALAATVGAAPADVVVLESALAAAAAVVVVPLKAAAVGRWPPEEFRTTFLVATSSGIVYVKTLLLTTASRFATALGVAETARLKAARRAKFVNFIFDASL